MELLDGYPSEIGNSSFVADATGEVIARNDHYVDVRGVNPIYVNGSTAYRLPGKPRDISVDDARRVVQALGL